MKGVVFLLFFSIVIQAQEYTIPFLNTSVKVDGNLKESVWKLAPSYSGFHNFYPDDVGKAKNQTTVKLYHNGEFLYVAVAYKEEEDKAVISSLKRDDYGGVIVESECFQLIIDTYNKKTNGYLFGVNSSNAQFDALVGFNGNGFSFNESWNTIWKSAQTKKNGMQFFEIAIPLKAFAYTINDAVWGINFVYRDMNPNNWMSFTDMSRNFIQYDLRNTVPFKLEKLPKQNNAKFIVIPSTTYNHQKNVMDNKTTSEFVPSLDAQYSITSSLKLDATIHPDFSQVDVDQQVTNLTRFAVNFPERRNFFIENSDLFSNLGTNEVNPFYSRRIGASGNMQFGLKLSGNITPKTRLGFLNVQTNKREENKAQNYGALVIQNQLTKSFTSTVFMLNRQETDRFNFTDNFNRVAGVNINYKSQNNKWTGVVNLGKSFTSDVKNKNQFYNLGVDYTTKKIEGSFSISKVDENYITDIGFVPRLYNYDAVNNEVIREGYWSAKSEVSLLAFPEKSKKIQTIRYFFPSNTTYWNEKGEITQSLTFVNQALFFRNTASVFVDFSHQYVDLQYGFDPLNNGNSIQPDEYSFGALQLGYNSPFNKQVSYSVGVQYGDYYQGTRTRFYTFSTFRLLPFAKIGADYEINYLNLKELGIKPFHLARFTGEVFFNNRLNWTTYIQYNTQQNNFNVNSRVQWEYKPLSYFYFVITDNFNQYISRNNWGISLKINHRFDF
ncbi:DUF5916 domain-containing protein [Tenacibaculum sp. ZS6-P6]|uniref:DUF5916 domain-containing protein n=1 Tax=Tenacibaculum sp. ZS6-P6 TaxID=3447503 RepID=UPI003F9D4C0D